MTLKSIAAKAGIATVALTALGLAAAMPASAHTNNMWTYIVEGPGEQSGLGTYGKTDGVATYLPTTYPSEMEYIAGIEVANEKGVILGANEASEGPYVAEWNHTTGAIGTQMSTYLTTEDELLGYDFLGLDTLNNGTTVTVVGYGTVSDGEVPIESNHWAIASVNVGTGELIPLVEFTDAISFEGDLIDTPTSIATDPATGITYVFLSNPADEAEYLAVDVAADTVGEVTLLQGEYFGDGQVEGADFDPGSGELFFNYDNYDDQDLQLLRLGAPSGWALAEPTFISTAPSNDADTFIAEEALTIEHTTLAATGSELPIAAWLLVGTLAVLTGGVTVTVARRRSESGTV